MDTCVHVCVHVSINTDTWEVANVHSKHKNAPFRTQWNHTGP